MAADAERLGAAESLGVLGAGTMGAGIVQVAAEARVQVLVHDPVPGAVDRARERISSFLARKVEKGEMSAQDREAFIQHADLLQLVDTDGGYARARGAESVVDL